MSLIPGIPQLPPNIATPAVATIASEAISALLWQAAQQPPAWGVFDSNGNQVLSPDSVIDFDHRQEYEISDFPVQAGEFASYNKVIRPFEIQLRFSKGGSVTDRTQFLQDIEDLAESIELYTVVTPERTYQNVNLQRYEVARRGAKRAYFLAEVDLYFIEVLQVTAQYTTTAVQLPNAQSPAAQPVTNVGSVSAQDVSSQIGQLGSSALASVPADCY